MWKEEIGGLAICGFIMAVVLYLHRNRSNERFPPGPFGLPVLGHLHIFLFLNLPTHRALAALAKKYGPVIGLRLGQQRAVVVSSPESARQVLFTHDKLFADRPSLQFSSLLQYGSDNGIFFNRHGPQWRRHRRICTLHLFTAKRLQELQHVRQQEIRALLLSIHDLSRAGTTPVDLGQCVGQMSSHLLMRLVQSSPADAQLLGTENLQDLFKEAEQAATPTIGDFIPSLSCLDVFRKQRMRRIHARIDKVCTKILMERMESASFHDDLLQSLLSQEDALTMVEIKGIILDMMAGGILTTALTLEWAMAELLRNPHCFHRLQKEIDIELGEEKQVRDVDVPNLSYLKCVVKEVFRLHPIGPLLIPHLSLEECELQDYIIPAKTLVFVNVWAIGRDERVWPHANEFIPERFEGSDLDVKGQHFELLPFGSGRRTCVAMPLALSIVEVTLANLVKCFDWELPDGNRTHLSSWMKREVPLQIKLLQ